MRPWGASQAARLTACGLGAMVCVHRQIPKAKGTLSEAWDLLVSLLRGYWEVATLRR